MIQARNLEMQCDHCGTSLTEHSSSRFCCKGCEFVFALLKSNGLDQYYQIRKSEPLICPNPVRPSQSNYEYFDDPEFTQNLSSNGLIMRFYIEGISCTACLWLLEKLPDYCLDAESARLDMANSILEVKRKAGGSFAQIAQTLNRFGYRPHPLRESEESHHLQIRERRKDLIRIGIAGALTGNIMILAISIYAGASGLIANQFRLLTMLLSAPVLTYCAWPFFLNSYQALVSKRLNIDVPIVVALLAGIAMSLKAIFLSQNKIYFDSLSTLVFLLLSSRFILKQIQIKQLNTSQLEDEILLSRVQRLNPNGELETLNSLALNREDLILLDHECIIPVDGTLESGIGLINASIMTGESEMLRVEPGAQIEAGYRLLEGKLYVRVKNLSRQSRLAKILKDTELSAKQKSHFVEQADQVAKWFMLSVFAGALAIILFFLSQNLQEGFTRAFTLIIVTCPCVFGFAIPLSMSFAIRGAAKRGIVIKNANAIERLWRIKTLIFDKTGTLTNGDMSVLQFDVYKEEMRTQALAISLSLEKNQSHPVAKALVKYIQHLGIAEANIEDIKSLDKGGISGFYKNQLYSIRPISMLAQKDSEKTLHSSFALFIGETQIAQFLLGDPIRSEAIRVFNWARINDLKLQIASGDRFSVVAKCAQKLGLNPDQFQAELSPEMKANLIASDSNPVAMIGDGANDALALAKASLGIAICGSLDVSLRAADVYLAQPKLESIVEFYYIAKLTQTAIFRNLFFSAGFNLFSGTLAVLGYMTPLWAAVLMPLSSLTVLLSAVWTKTQIHNLKVEL